MQVSTVGFVTHHAALHLMQTSVNYSILTKMWVTTYNQDYFFHLLRTTIKSPSIASHIFIPCPLLFCYRKTNQLVPCSSTLHTSIKSSFDETRYCSPCRSLNLWKNQVSLSHLMIISFKLHTHGPRAVKQQVNDGVTDLPMEPSSISVAESSSLIL